MNTEVLEDLYAEDDNSLRYKHHLIIVGCHRICLASLHFAAFNCLSQRAF